MADSTIHITNLDWAPVQSAPPDIVSLWQVKFKDYKGGNPKHHAHPYYYASTEGMPSAWRTIDEMENLLLDNGCPEVEALFWSAMPGEREGTRLFLFGPKSVLERWSADLKVERHRSSRPDPRRHGMRFRASPRT